jgi:hypothetical protein
MCIFSGVLGNGAVLTLQGLTVISIAASIVFWVWAFSKSSLKERLHDYAVPICLWILFGTLDILITAKGTFGNPYREGNQLARFIFAETGFAGPLIASVLWITLWAGIVFGINKLKMPLAGFASLSVFYSLAAGHFSGFSSWYEPFCGLSLYRLAPDLPALNVAIGISAALAHLGAAEIFRRMKKE